FCLCVAYPSVCFPFFLNFTATSVIYTLSLHDALPISHQWPSLGINSIELLWDSGTGNPASTLNPSDGYWGIGLTHLYKIQETWRSEEHTSELQSRENLVCRLLLEKKKDTTHPRTTGNR